jgi:hypothetical protein
MATEIHLYEWSEPPKIVTITSLLKKRGLGQVQFLSQLLHPNVLARFR